MLRADTWLILGIGVVTAAVGFRLLVDPSTRRPQFRGRPRSRRSAWLVAAAIFSFCALLAWLNLRWR